MPSENPNEIQPANRPCPTKERHRKDKEKRGVVGHESVVVVCLVPCQMAQLLCVAAAASHELADPVHVEPADLLKRGPQFGRLVDVNLAGLLGVGLAELLALNSAGSAADEDAPLAGEVRSAVQSEVGRQAELVRVQEVGVRVLAEIDRRALPVDLEAVGLVRERVERRAEILERVEVTILAVRRDHAAPGLGRNTVKPALGGAVGAHGVANGRAGKAGR